MASGVESNHSSSWIWASFLLTTENGKVWCHDESSTKIWCKRIFSKGVYVTIQVFLGMQHVFYPPKNMQKYSQTFWVSPVEYLVGTTHWVGGVGPATPDIIIEYIRISSQKLSTLNHNFFFCLNGFGTTIPSHTCLLSIA